jgi:hypothetical protein
MLLTITKKRMMDLVKWQAQEIMMLQLKEKRLIAELKRAKAKNKS